MNYRLPLLLLTLTLTSTCATTVRAQTPAAKATYCLDAPQMRLIAWDLKKYAALKPVVDSLRVENGLLYRQKSLLERTVTTQDSLLAQHERARGLQGLLQTSAQHERDQWKARAKARWWTSLGLGAVALLLGAAAVQ